MGPGWRTKRQCIQIYGRRPWDNPPQQLIDDIKRVYKELLEEPDFIEEVKAVVAPFREEHQVQWIGLVKSKAALVKLIQLYEELQQEEDDMEVMLLCS